MNRLVYLFCVIVVGNIFLAKSLYAHGLEIQKRELSKSTFSKRLTKGQLISCKSISGAGDAEYLTLNTFYKYLRVRTTTFPISGDADTCKRINRKFSELEENWDSFKIQLNRTFVEEIVLYHNACRVFIYFHDEFEIEGGKTKIDTPVSEDTYFNVNLEAGEESAKDECLRQWKKMN